MPKRPNLLFILADQHRWCDLNCYGNSTVASPTFDTLASQGVRFRECVSNTPLCVPARASLLTGQLGAKHRAITNDLPIDTNIQSVAHVLGEAGYRTGYIGKWHLAGVPRDKPIPPGPQRLGFDAWKVHNCSHDYVDATYYDENDEQQRHIGYEPYGQTSLARDFIEAGGCEPWALYLSWGPPHDPYGTADRRYLNLYDPNDVLLRPNVPELVKDTLTSRLTRDDIRRNLAGYYAHITALNDQLARLLDALERTGQRENTIVVYTSDHGDMLGSQGFTNKQMPYEESIRVPLLISWPGMVRQGCTDELIGLVDLPVTLLALMDLSFDEPTDGADLSAVLRDPHAKGLDACYITDLVPCHQAALRGGREWRGIRTTRFTFARSAADDGYLLYDNIVDPYQQVNLIDNPSWAQVCAELRRELDELVDRHDVLLPWQDLVRHLKLTEEWNMSQAHHGLPLLPN